MLSDQCPCKDCSNRCVGCHGICESYKSWRIQMDEANKKERAVRISGYADSYLMKLHWRNVRRKI